MNTLSRLLKRLFRVRGELRSVFVCNDSKKPIQNLTCNLLPKLVRHDTMEGKDYIVVPMVMLTEGVHRGSEGALYYPPSELSKTPVVWNHKPVVVYHPEINGVGVSACDPDVLTNHKIGVIMNTKYEAKTGRLKAEAWIDPERANVVDPRIMAAVNEGKMMELSTGVFVDSDGDPGKWNKEDYTGIARNYRPDHLAVLPDKIGACSIKDGAGFLRNQSNDIGLGPSSAERVGGRLSKSHRDNEKRAAAALKGDPNTYEPGVGGESSNPQVNEERKESLLVRIAHRLGISLNAEDLAFDYIRTQLSDAICEECGCNEKFYSGPRPWIVDVFSNFFVYEYNGELYRLGYETSDEGVTLSDEDPVEVERTPPQYRPVQMAAGGDSETKDKTMNKQQLVGQIIANSNGALTEADRPRLEAFGEEQLKKLSFMPPQANNQAQAQAGQTAAVVTNASADDSDDDEDEDDMPPKKKGKKPAKNEAQQAARPLTMAEYIDAAPPEMREVLNSALGGYNQQKKDLVAKIVKNGVFTEAELNNKPMGELLKLAQLAKINSPAATRTLDYSGQAPVQMEESNTQEVLMPPTMNFETKPAAAAK